MTVEPTTTGVQAPPAGPEQAAGQAHSHGKDAVPEQSRSEWTTSWDIADFPVPHGREEQWRFTPVEDLSALLADEAAAAAPAWNVDQVEGVTVSTISREQARELGAQAPADRAAAVTATHTKDVLHVDIAADVELAAPLHISLKGAGEQAHGQVLVTTGTHSKVTLVLEHTGTGRLGELLTLVAGDGSSVTMVSTQEWEDDAQHLAQHDVVVGRDAAVRHVALTLGGHIVRVNTNATYQGPGGSFDGLGVYFADGGQHLEHRLFVDHATPRCASNVEYKGALQGETAHTVWVGDVLIRAAAEGTETYELNRNLLLTDGARADSIPNLEIETGEIEGAGHASATGRFDDEHLFYLRSRGIPEIEARRMVVRGFFADVVNRIGVPEVSERVMTAVEAELEQAMGTPALSGGAQE